MKRDLDIARAILLAIELSPNYNVSSDDIVVAGHSRDEVRYNANLLLEERYIAGDVYQILDDRGASEVNIQRMTWKGHDFLDVARAQETWDAAKQRAAKVGGNLTFGLMKDLLVAVIKDQLGLKDV